MVGLLASFAVATPAALAEGTAKPRAQAPRDGRDAEARALYDAAVVAFDEGRFRNALESFQRAYELSQRPELLYNIGSAADRLRLDAVALDAFERYIAELPNGPNAQSVVARIQVLREAVELSRHKADAPPVTPMPPVTEGTGAVAPAAPAAPPPPPPAMPPPPARKSRWAQWTLVGVGSGLVAAGATTLGFGQRNRGKIEDAKEGTSFDSVKKYENADTLTVTGTVLLGVGVGALAAGTIWLLGTEDEPGLGVQVSLTGLQIRGAL